MNSHFKLINDLDLTDCHFYEIGSGNYSYGYYGVFDGNSHTVSNLTIEGKDSLGLFGFLGEGSEVKDLGVVDAMARHRVLTLSDEQLALLQHERLHHEHPRVRQRMDVLWLRANGLTQIRVAEMLGVSRHTVAEYENRHETGGIDAVKDFKWGGRVSPLQAYVSEIEAFLEEHPPRTLEEACDLIEELTGIRREKSFVREFLHSLKIRRLKTGMIPAKTDPQQQDEFLKKSLNHV